MNLTPENFDTQSLGTEQKAELVDAIHAYLNGLPVRCSPKVLKVFNAIVVPPKNGKLHKSIIDTWSVWREQSTGIKPEVRGKQLAAAKNLTAYFLRIAKSEEKAFEIMPLIVLNWDRLNPFLQSGVDLNQIAGNINLIIEQIKNGQPTRKKQHATDSDLEAAVRRKFGNGAP